MKKPIIGAMLFSVALGFSSPGVVTAQSLILCDTTANDSDITDLKSMSPAIDSYEKSLLRVHLKGIIDKDTYGAFNNKRNNWYESMSRLETAKNTCSNFLVQINEVIDQYNYFLALFNRAKALSLVDDQTVPDIKILDPLWSGSKYTNDQYIDRQYYIKHVRAGDKLTGQAGEPVVVAVVDDGIYINHDDLKQNIWRNADESPGNNIDDDRNGYIDDIYGFDFISNDDEMTVRGSHGTAVAGVIGATSNNSIGIAGLGGNVKLMPLIACSDSGCPTTAVIQAITYAVDNGAKVINLSLSSNGTTAFSTVYNEVIRYAREHSVLVVAAAGNGDVEGSNGQDLDFIPQSPVCNDNAQDMVFGVSAVNPFWLVESWANHGSCVDAYAPGRGILTTTVPALSGGSQYGYEDGTSFSAPIASALAAQVLQKFPTAQPDEVATLIKNNLDEGVLNFSKTLMPGFTPRSLAAPAPVIGNTTNVSHGYDPIAERVSSQTISGDKGIQGSGSSDCPAGSVIKGSSSAVYYCGEDGKRYVFATLGTYLTWYSDFSAVRQVSDEQLGRIPIGGNVTYRPGIRMVKIQTDAHVYAVSKNGLLRLVTSETVARDIYGAEWNKLIDDIPDAFFVNYRIGDPIF